MPFPPGSGTDILARLISDRLSRKWGQPVVVDNMGGAGGNIGGEAVARAVPDGYTLLFVPAPPLAINQFVYKKLGYDPAKLTPISMVSSVPYALVARKNFPASNLKELIDYAKANPGKITYASSSVGSTAQLATLQLMMMTDTKMLHVPYRGAAPALNDVMAGHVDLVFDIVSTAAPMLDSGQVKVLGTGGDTRSRIMPSVPTIAEASRLPGADMVRDGRPSGPAGRDRRQGFHRHQRGAEDSRSRSAHPRARHGRRGPQPRSFRNLLRQGSRALGQDRQGGGDFVRLKT
jgi:tripartite-type tricarboxylate transporter receptor subunit TctC